MYQQINLKEKLQITQELTNHQSIIYMIIFNKWSRYSTCERTELRSNSVWRKNSIKNECNWKPCLFQDGVCLHDLNL